MSKKNLPKKNQLEVHEGRRYIRVNRSDLKGRIYVGEYSHVNDPEPGQGGQGIWGTELAIPNTLWTKFLKKESAQIMKNIFEIGKRRHLLAGLSALIPNLVGGTPGVKLGRIFDLLSQVPRKGLLLYTNDKSDAPWSDVTQEFEMLGEEVARLAQLLAPPASVYEPEWRVEASYVKVVNDLERGIAFVSLPSNAMTGGPWSGICISGPERLGVLSLTVMVEVSSRGKKITVLNNGCESDMFGFNFPCTLRKYVSQLCGSTLSSNAVNEILNNSLACQVKLSQKMRPVTHEQCEHTSCATLTNVRIDMKDVPGNEGRDN